MWQPLINDEGLLNVVHSHAELWSHSPMETIGQCVYYLPADTWSEDAANQQTSHLSPHTPPHTWND